MAQVLKHDIHKFRDIRLKLGCNNWVSWKRELLAMARDRGLLLRTKVAKGIPRHYKVTQGFLELLMMTANGRVQRGCSLSFDASPPDVPLSSIWTDGASEGLEGSDETKGSSEGTIYVDFRLRKHT